MADTEVCVSKAGLGIFEAAGLLEKAGSCPRPWPRLGVPLMVPLLAAIIGRVIGSVTWFNKCDVGVSKRLRIA